MACTKTGSKNDLFLNCRRKPKELSKKELSNVAPASKSSPYRNLCTKDPHAISLHILKVAIIENLDFYLIMLESNLTMLLT